MIVSVFCAELGSFSDTCTLSVYGASRRSSHIFHVLMARSPCSALCLVQQRIHALRQSTLVWISRLFSVKVDLDP